MTLASCYGTTKNGPNCKIFLNDLPIIFKNEHKSLYINYTLVFCVIFFENAFDSELQDFKGFGGNKIFD